MNDEMIYMWPLLWRKRIALSGGFDPIHVGHLRMIESASEHGDVIIILNSDDWLKRKKGYAFMSWADRAEILRSIWCVSKVISVDDSDNTICEALKLSRPDYFGNGGDRTSQNTPEKDLCEKLNIKMIWGLGGGKIQSSSDLIKGVKNVLDENVNKGNVKK